MNTFKGLMKPLLVSVLAVSAGYAFAVDPAAGMGVEGMHGEGVPAFDDFDLDGDKAISKEEFTKARTSKISERAAQGRQMRGLADIVSFEEIDTNNDGLISPEEFAAATKKMQEQKQGERMNQRGAMGQGQGMNQGQGRGQGQGMNQGQGRGQGQGMNQGQGRGQGQGMNQGQGMGRGGAQQNAMPSFADFDLNNDGKISEKEFTEARTARISERATEGRQMRGLADAASFADIDTNNDGSISPEEFEAYQQMHRQNMGR